MTIASVVVPPGDYVIVANVTVHNFSSPPTSLPVNCVIGTPAGFSVPYGVRIDPFNAVTGQGASSATISLTYAAHLVTGGTVTLQGQTNTGPGGQMAFAESRQITAIRVGALTKT